jgi:hypothetical protein
MDVELLASCAFDALTLIEKWREPLKTEGKKLVEAFKPVAESFNARGNKYGEAINKILKNMEKRNNWEERFTPDAEKEYEINNLSRSEWRHVEQANKAYDKLEEAKIPIRRIKLSELNEAIKTEYKTWVIRRTNETLNEHWKRLRKGFTSKTDASKFVEPETKA